MIICLVLHDLPRNTCHSHLSDNTRTNDRSPKYCKSIYSGRAAGANTAVLGGVKWRSDFQLSAVATCLRAVCRPGGPARLG